MARRFQVPGVLPRYQSPSPSSSGFRQKQQNLYIQEWLDGNEIKSSESCAHDGGLAETLYHSCMDLFEDLWAAFCRAPLPVKSGLKKTLHGNISRLYLWGSNFEAGKLDTILGESEELRDEILDLLCGISVILIQKIAPLALPGSITSISLKEKIIGLSDLVAKASTTIENIEDDTDSNSDWLDLNALRPSSEPRFSSGELSTYTECLMELSDTVVRHISLLSLAKDGEGRLENEVIHAVEPAHPFIRHVSDKFPQADSNLITRLGQANWERRERIQRQMDSALQEEKVAPGQRAGLAPSLFKPTSLFHDSGLGSSIPASVASHRSYASIPASKANTTLRVPQTPVALGEHFKCDYCGRHLQNIRSRIDWKRHVFADLQPYICTWSGCENLNTFPTRKLWVDHEYAKHRVEHFWQCHECDTEFSDRNKYVVHMGKEHTLLASRTVPSLTRSAAVRNTKCPLCLNSLRHDLKSYETHVGSHMEDIALACLPKDVESDSEGDNENETGGQKLDERHQLVSDVIVKNKPEARDLATGSRERRELRGRRETRYNEYFLPGEGISREVIQADICRYIGNDALVRPGTYEGRDGYLIKSYRNLTSEMISDLKADSARWEAERRQALSQQDPRDPSRYQLPQYVNSATYEDSIAWQDEMQSNAYSTPQSIYGAEAQRTVPYTSAGAYHGTYPAASHIQDTESYHPRTASIPITQPPMPSSQPLYASSYLLQYPGAPEATVESRNYVSSLVDELMRDTRNFSQG